jgi:CRISPR-associated endonuclease Cas1
VTSAVVLLHGYAVRVDVERGQLRARDGVGADGREQVFGRSTSGLKRLVVLGHNGSISFEAIRWLHDVGASYLQLDRDGVVLAASGPLGTDRPGLRRAQACALYMPLGLRVAKHLISHKLEAQLRTLDHAEQHGAVAEDARQAITSSLLQLPPARDRAEVRLVEAQGAAAYWGAWRSMEVRFARQDAGRLPPHWTTFGSRTSPLTGGPRLAANPANAILNYLYALLEAEATFAARVVGLDPGLGVLHADQLNRDSLSADLMEPIRPHVDRYLANLLATRSFAARDFVETRQGVCRISPPLARELSETSPHWGRLVGTVAEDVARLFEAGAGTSGVFPTPLSGRNRSTGRGASARRRSFAVRVPSQRCTTCGNATPAGRRTCGADCEKAAHGDSLVAFAAAGTKALARFRATGNRPEIGSGARSRIGGRAAELTAAAREWQRNHQWPEDMDTFGREILPGLADVSPQALVEATGMSLAYCRRVKRGLAVPHPMWWRPLAELKQATTLQAEPMGTGSKVAD